MNDILRTFKLVITENETEWQCYAAAEASCAAATHENRLRAVGLETLAEQLKTMACQLRKGRLDA